MRSCLDLVKRRLRGSGIRPDLPARWPGGVRIALLVVLLGTGLGCGDPEGGPTATVRERRSADPRAMALHRASQEALRAGRWDLALARADSAGRLAPRLADAPYLRGRILVEMGRLDEAEEAFREALALDPLYPGAWFQIGHVAFRERRYEEALAAYRKEERLLVKARDEGYLLPDRDPRALPAVRLQIGRMHAALGAGEAAKERFVEVLAEDGASAAAHLELATMYDREGDPERALDHARRAYALRPDGVEEAYTLGLLLLRAGEVEDAVAPLEEAAARQPWHAGALYNLGRALDQLGHAERAARYFTRADSMQALQHLIGQAELTARQQRNQPGRWLELARLLDRAGRHEEARRAVEQARAVASSP